MRSVLCVSAKLCVSHTHTPLVVKIAAIFKRRDLALVFVFLFGFGFCVSVFAKVVISVNTKAELVLFGIRH